MKNRPIWRGMENKLRVCVGGRAVTVEATLPLYFPSKMRWMVAINSAVTISWRVKRSRNRQRGSGTDERGAVFVFVCLHVCLCTFVRVQCLNTVCLGTLGPTVSSQEAAICWLVWMKPDRSIQYLFKNLPVNREENYTVFGLFLGT